MFDNNKKTTNTPKKSEISSDSISAIPDDFYGGKDPVIYQPKNNTAAKVETQKASQKPEKKSLVSTPPPLPPKATPRQILVPTVNKNNQTTASQNPVGPSQNQFTQPAPEKKSKAGTVVFIILVLLLLGGGTAFAWWYFSKNSDNNDAQLPPPPPVVSDPVVPPPIDLPPIGTPNGVTVTSTEEVQDEENNEESSNALISFTRIALSNTVDLDGDGLTDQEESIFEVDPGVFDSDLDGYRDGLEVVNLYSPKDFAPTRLIDSGVVKEYIHPNDGYRIFYPSNWEIGNVDAQNNQIIVSDSSGEFVDIQIITKKSGETLQEWFGRVTDGENFSDYNKFTNRFGENGWQRRDNLVYLFEFQSKVYILTYRPQSEGVIPFRQIMIMTAQSFRPQASIGELEEQELIPGVLPISTSTDESENSNDEPIQEPEDTTSTDPNEPEVNTLPDNESNTSTEENNDPISEQSTSTNDVVTSS